MKTLLKWIGVMALSSGYAIYRCFVITKVWGYIAVRMFHLSPIGLWEAFAVSCLVGIFTYSCTVETSKDKEPEAYAGKLLGGFLVLSAVWGIDYLIFC